MNYARKLHVHARFAAACSLAVVFAACSDNDSSPGGDASAGAGGDAIAGKTSGAGAGGGKAGSGSGGKDSNGGGGTDAVGGAGKSGSAGSSTAGSGGSGGHAGSGDPGGGGTSAQAGEAGHGGDAVDDGASGQSGDGGAGGRATDLPDAVTGSGADGDLSVESVVDLSAANSGSRSCADGGDAVSYAVTALLSDTATLAAAPAAGCLAVGDEVLLISLQGTAAHFANVGNYETLRVSAVSDSTVTFSKAKSRFYGDAVDDDANLGTARTNQRVMLQRIPNYRDVSIGAAGSLSASAWDGTKGGVLFFRAAGMVSVAGNLSMSGKGYAGGAQTTDVNTSGQQGESIHGLGDNLQAASEGAGGGGLGDQNGCESFGTSGGGGGYASPGGDGTTACSGKGGNGYGEASLLSRLLLGSGGGAGGSDDYLGDNPPGGFGGRGGGIVVVAAASLQVTGALVSSGSDGEGDGVSGCTDGGSTTNCWDFSGPGGGGSGGSILLNASESSLGTQLVEASGGLGGLGESAGDGGDGSEGRIAVRASTLAGTTLPAAELN